MNSVAYLGDCIDGMAKMPPGSVGCVVTSPPYNIGVSYGKYKDARDDYGPWLSRVFSGVYRVLDSHGHFFLQVGGTAKRPLLPWTVAGLAVGAGFVVQNQIVWVKSIAIGDTTYGQFKPVNSDRFLNQTGEFIFHMTKTGAEKIDRLSIGVPFVHPSNLGRWNHKNTRRCRGNIWHIPYETIQSKAERYGHPATFPVALPVACIRLSGAQPGSLILDPFVGTGATLVAAEQLGMKGVGFDVDQDYVNAANSRLVAQTYRASGPRSKSPVG